MKGTTSSNNSSHYNLITAGNDNDDTTTTLAIIALILTGTAATSFSFITLRQLYWPKETKTKKSNNHDDDSDESMITTEKKETVVIETISSLEKKLLLLSSSSSSSKPTNSNNTNEPITDALTPLTIQILTATSNIVGSTKTANIFYHNLFTSTLTPPDLKELFSTQNFAAQSLKFGQMMKWTTTTLQYLYLSSSTTTTRITNSSGGRHNNNNKNSSNIIQSIKDLGFRHIKYGIKLKHFHPVKRALLDTIRELDFSSVSIDNDNSDSNTNNFDDSQNNNQIGLEVEGFSSPTQSSLSKHKNTINNNNNTEKQHQPLIPTTNDIVRAWESLIYVFVGYMGPILLQHSPNESIQEYRLALENDLAAPAGGTATAISASQGVALLIMSIKLTKKQDFVEKLQNGNYELKLQSIMDALQYLAQQDMEVYCRVMVAVRQPPLNVQPLRIGGDSYSNNNNNNNKQVRKQAIDDSLDLAVTIPTEVVQWSILALQIAIDILPLIAKSGIGDAGAGCYMIIAAAKTGLQNIRINTKTLPPPPSSSSSSSNNPKTSSTNKSSIKQKQQQKKREELISNLILTLDWQEKKLIHLLP